MFKSKYRVNPPFSWGITFPPDNLGNIHRATPIISCKRNPIVNMWICSVNGTTIAVANPTFANALKSPKIVPIAKYKMEVLKRRRMYKNCIYPILKEVAYEGTVYKSRLQ